MIKDVIKRCLPRTLGACISNSRAINHWEHAGRPSPPTPTYKQFTIREYAVKYNTRTFIEMVTYLANMVEAMKAQFDKMYSIELDDKLFKNASAKFEQYPPIEIISGDSAQELPHLLDRLNGQCLFWLDGHYSGQYAMVPTARGNLHTPIIQEIQHISLYCEKYNLGPVILIDDARCFNGTDDYPEINDFQSEVSKLFTGSQFDVIHDIIRIVK